MRGDRGFLLLEVIVAICVLGMVAVPTSRLLVTLVRTADSVRTEAEVDAFFNVAGLVVAGAPLPGCTSSDVRALVLEHAILPAGLDLEVTVDCSIPGLVIVDLVLDGTVRQVVGSLSP